MKETEVFSLDIRGQICPSCLLLTLKELNTRAEAIRGGYALVEVLTDDRQAANTIPGASDKMGFQTEVTRTEDGYRIRVFGK